MSTWRVRGGAAAVLVVAALVMSGCSSAGSGTATPGSKPVVAAPVVASGAPVPSPGCTASTAPKDAAASTAPTGGPVTQQRQDLTVDGTQRWYLLTTPAPTATPTPRPLVLDFHGLDEGAGAQATTSQFSPLAVKDGFVVAFPNGTGVPVGWDTSATSHPNADLDFVRAMLTGIEASQCIDTSRVYADGFSDGAYMVSLLACTMAGTFAAIAAVSGLQMPVPCKPSRPVPILAFHGTADPILYFNGGVGTAYLKQVMSVGSAPPTTTPARVDLDGPGYPATVKAWAVKDGCSTHFTDTRIGSQVIHRTYPCPAGVGVGFYIVLGGGHAWPGSKFSQSIERLTGFTTFQVNATNAIWAFFRQYRLS